MYKISVPVINNRVDRESGGRELVLSELGRIGAERVFLSLGTHIVNKEKRKKEFDILKENCKFFKSHNLEAGAWIWSFLPDSETGFTRIRGANGQAADGNCPADGNFIRFMQEYVKEIAECGADLIMFDDDFRFGHQTGDIACTCEHHMKRIGEILGEDITPEKLREKALTGGGNRYRDAWMRANGESLIAFAKAMREAVDSVNPAVRMGQCSCMSSWGVDGALPEEVARAFAGGTRPFFRLIGAPYWAVDRHFNNSRLQNVIEFERMQKSFCTSDAEVFAEGDTYPRPRHWCPSSYLELFDIAMRADGKTDGILKYAIDYWSRADYETGYADRHVKNKKAYEWIEKNASAKPAVGVRVYESPDKLKTMVLPEKAKRGAAVYEVMFSPASKMLSDCSVPTVYSGRGVCSAAFDENIKSVPEEELKKGVIIDMRAADVLSGRGIDVGVAGVGEQVHSECERFESGNEVNTPGGVDAYRLTLKENCTVLSRFISGDGDEIPAVFVYKNSSGQVFTVLNFDAYFGNDLIYRSYARSGQIAHAVKLMTGKRLPAYSYGNPDLYIMAKRDSGAMTVCLFNIFADTAENPVIKLDEEYREAEFFGCTGKISGRCVILSDIAPFAFAGILLKK